MMSSRASPSKRLDTIVIPTELDARHPDRWVGDALFLPGTRQKFRVLYHLGLTDAVRAGSDGPGPYTFWDYQTGAWQKNDGIRIDHLLLSPQVTFAQALANSKVLLDAAKRAGVRSSDSPVGQRAQPRPAKRSSSDNRVGARLSVPFCRDLPQTRVRQTPRGGGPQASARARIADAAGGWRILPWLGTLARRAMEVEKQQCARVWRYPVMLPPGRARLATRPVPTGS
jgi:hypothetical protein